MGDTGGPWRGGNTAMVGSRVASMGAAGLDAVASDGARGAAESVTAGGGGEMRKMRFAKAPKPHARDPPLMAEKRMVSDMWAPHVRSTSTSSQLNTLVV